MKTLILTLAFAVIGASVAFAAHKEVYLYRCTKCYLVEKFKTRGEKKCPRCGSKMKYFQTFSVYE